MKAVYFTGAGGSGKTSLVEELCGSPNYVLSTVATRGMMPLGVKSHADVVKYSAVFPEGGIEFQSSLIETRLAELHRLKKTDDPRTAVSDRSAVDSWIYYLVQNSVFDTEQNSTQLKNKAEEFVLQADVHIVLKTSDLPNIVNDKVRTSNIHNARMLEALMFSFFKEMQEKYAFPTSVKIIDGVSVSSLLGGKVIVLDGFTKSIKDRAWFLVHNIL